MTAKNFIALKRRFLINAVNVTQGHADLRDGGAVANSLEKLKQAAKTRENTMPSIN